MGKIKIIFLILFFFISYKGYHSFKAFKLDTTNRITQIKKSAGFEVRQDNIVALCMFSGKPKKLREHYLVSTKEKCIELRNNARVNSSALYNCAFVNAIIENGKIKKIIKVNREINDDV
jgi:hypothetical protein